MAKRPMKSDPPWPADKVERWPIDKLLPYARNARTHSSAQVAQIAASIVEWGWTIPVLVDAKGTLIAGHGRILAAHLLKIKAVPTMVAVGWSPAQIKSYRIADNQLSLVAGWDDQLLAVELADLKVAGADLALTALSPDEIERLLAGPQAPEEFAAHDENIETAHQCPKCGFRWSGGAPAPEDAEAAE
jgi:ParB-like chromosome segregation protein Spo0J